MTRVSTGHHLHWSDERGSEQVEAYRLTGTPQPADESPEEVHRHVSDVFVRAIRRHRPANRDTSLLLSGGLDSRLVAACLVESGISTRAVILGQPDDHEVIAGCSVATQLGMPHDVLSTESMDSQFTGAVCDYVRFGHLSSAPSAEDFAEGLSLAGPTGSFFWSGVPLDWVFQPISSFSGRDRITGHWSFDRLLSTMNRWGVPARQLPELLGRDGGDLVDTVVAGLRTACLQGPLPPEIQSSAVRWDQRVKNHVASALHRTTFRSWPLLPGLDRSLVEAVIGLPVSAYEGRKLEADILLAHRPDLAPIPVDGNSFRFAPLSSRNSHCGRVGRLLQKIDRHLRAYYWQRIRRFRPETV